MTVLRTLKEFGITETNKIKTMNNYNKVTEIANKHLGKVGGEGYKDTYDYDLLVRIPRELNREQYNIDNDNLPFVGYDIWNAYEVSALTEKGLPVSGMMKIICPSDSKYHVESKSIKLYLNSFNMTVMGEDTYRTIRNFESKVAEDLSRLLETNVKVVMFTGKEPVWELEPKGYSDLGDLIKLDDIEFTDYDKATPLLVEEKLEKGKEFAFRSNLLRSNCRVTNQPDWGDVLVYMKSKNKPDFESVAKYIVSHRKISHFHEEIAEMLYTHFMEAYQPSELLVVCLYTRRGGIDINPVRATSSNLISEDYYSEEVILKKTIRQ